MKFKKIISLILTTSILLCSSVVILPSVSAITNDKAVTTSIEENTTSENISSTNNLTEYQEVTLNLKNADSYYFGKTDKTFNFNKVEKESITQKISEAGTYYLILVKNNIISGSSITFCQTTLNTNSGKVKQKNILTEKGKTIALPKATKDKYSFKGWYLGNNKNTIYNNIKVTSNKTYNALWIVPKITVKIQNKALVKSGYKKFFSYNKKGKLSDWYKYSVNCNEKVEWKPSDAKAKKVLTIKNDTKKGIVTFSLNNKAVSTNYYKVECIVANRKVFSMELYFSDLEKLSNVKINRNKKNTVSLSWNKTINSQKYLVTITDKNTNKTIYKTLPLKSQSYKYTKLNSKHKYLVSVRLIFTFKNITYYGDAKSKTI